MMIAVLLGAIIHELPVAIITFGWPAGKPNASWLEYMDWNDDLWVEPALPRDGKLKPGHGLRFKPEVISDHRVGGFEISFSRAA